MKLPPLKPVIIGLDPGRSTGLAVFSRKLNKIIHSGTTDFYAAQLLIVRSFPDNRGKTIEGKPGRNEKLDVHIYIERPPRFIFGRNNNVTPEQREDIISKCGGTRREAELLHHCLTARGYDCTMVLPINEPKWNYERCSVATGSKKRTSSHERDAIRLALNFANYRKELR